MNTAPKKSSKGIYFTIISIALGIAAGLVVAEVLIRMLEAERTLPQTEEAKSNGETRGRSGEKFYLEVAPFSYKFETRPTEMQLMLKGFALEPNDKVPLNSHGFRGEEFLISRPPETYRILVLGDSFAWGDGVKTEQAFPSVLENLLNEACKDKETKFEVINLALKGNRLADNYITLLAVGEALEPDLILIQFFDNDLDFYFELDEEGEDAEFWRKLIETSALGKKTVETIKKIEARRRAVDARIEQIEGDTLERKLFEEIMRRLKERVDKRGAPTAFVAFPLIDTNPSGKNFSGYTSLPAYFAAMDKIYAEIEARGFPLLRLKEEFSRSAPEEYLAVSENDGHPNELAHSIAARALVNFLSEKGLARCDLTPKPPSEKWEEEKRLREKAKSERTEFNANLYARERFYEQTLSLLPKNVWIVAQLAVAYAETGKTAKSDALFSKLIELAPEIASPYFHMAENSREESEKLKRLNRMLEILPEQSATRLYAARLALKRGDKELAREHLSIALIGARNSKRLKEIAGLLAENGR